MSVTFVGSERRLPPSGDRASLQLNARQAELRFRRGGLVLLNINACAQVFLHVYMDMGRFVAAKGCQRNPFTIFTKHALEQNKRYFGMQLVSPPPPLMYNSFSEMKVNMVVISRHGLSKWHKLLTH